jgi:hypothetical protein
MSHQDSGHYAAKHAADTPINSEIAEAVKKFVEQGKISCARTHQIAKELGVSPMDVGKTIDLLEIRITQCQLGLFAKRETSNTPLHTDEVSSSLTSSLQAAQSEGRLSCQDAWRIAEEQGLSKAVIGAACDVLRIKLVACQLGTF